MLEKREKRERASEIERHMHREEGRRGERIYEIVANVVAFFFANKRNAVRRANSKNIRTCVSVEVMTVLLAVEKDSQHCQ